MSRVEPTFPDVFPLRFIFQDVRTQGTETMERLTQTELAGWHVWCHKFINGRDPVGVEPAVLLSYAAWHGMMCDHEFDLKPQNSPAFLTSKAASLPVASRLELYKIAGLTELEALPLSLPAVAREARRQVEMRRVREAAGLLVDKPGPEFSKRTRQKRRTKPRMNVAMVQEHFQEVLRSENRDLIQDYLTLAETKLAQRIGCSRNTLRACESFKNRDSALRLFNRDNG